MTDMTIRTMRPDDATQALSIVERRSPAII